MASFRTLVELKDAGNDRQIGRVLHKNDGKRRPRELKTGAAAERETAQGIGKSNWRAEMKRQVVVLLRRGGNKGGLGASAPGYQISRRHGFFHSEVSVMWWQQCKSAITTSRGLLHYLLSKGQPAFSRLSRPIELYRVCTVASRLVAQIRAFLVWQGSGRP